MGANDLHYPILLVRLPWLSQTHSIISKWQPPDGARKTVA